MMVFEIEHTLLALSHQQHLNADEALKHPACGGLRSGFPLLIQKALVMGVEGLAQYPLHRIGNSYNLTAAWSLKPRSLVNLVLTSSGGRGRGHGGIDWIQERAWNIACCAKICG